MLGFEFVAFLFLYHIETNSLFINSFFFFLVSYFSLENNYEEQGEKQIGNICQCSSAFIIPWGPVFCVIFLFGKCSRVLKEALIMTTLPGFGQKSHTSLNFDAVLNFLTFCEVVLCDVNIVTHKKFFSISPPSTSKNKV